MKRKLLAAFAVMAFIGSAYSWMCLTCIASQINVSKEEYMRMSQEIVKQKVQER